MFTFKIKVSLKIFFSGPNNITANDTYVTDAKGKTFMYYVITPKAPEN